MSRGRRSFGKEPTVQFFSPKSPAMFMERTKRLKRRHLQIDIAACLMTHKMVACSSDFFRGKEAIGSGWLTWKLLWVLPEFSALVYFFSFNLHSLPYGLPYTPYLYYYVFLVLILARCPLWISELPFADGKGVEEGINAAKRGKNKVLGAIEDWRGGFYECLNSERVRLWAPINLFRERQNTRS